MESMQTILTVLTGCYALVHPMKTIALCHLLYYFDEQPIHIPHFVVHNVINGWKGQILWVEAEQPQKENKRSDHNVVAELNMTSTQLAE